jgi:hypothetical protein
MHFEKEARREHTMNQGNTINIHPVSEGKWKMMEGRRHLYSLNHYTVCMVGHQIHPLRQATRFTAMGNLKRA